MIFYYYYYYYLKPMIAKQWNRQSMIILFAYSLVWKLAISIVSKPNWVIKLKKICSIEYLLLLYHQHLYLQCWCTGASANKYLLSKYKAE